MGPTLSDRRASSLYSSVGFSPEEPPNVVRFARALLGAHCLTFLDGERACAVRALSRGHIYLQKSAPKEENVFAIVLGLARWDLEQSGPGVPLRSLALSIALPFEVMTRFHAEGLTTEQIATDYHLALDVVRARQTLFPALLSTRRLRVAESVAHLAEDVAADAG